MSTIKVNINGINELDFTSGVSSATVTSPGVVSLAVSGADNPGNDLLTDGINDLVFAAGDVIWVIIL
jgi:hypothetical protein